MRARTAGALSVGVAALVGAGTALLACTDLFISTGDVITACEIDATTPGCGGDAGPVDVCTWTHADALAHAQHACAWLGACETPLGRNAFGPCMFQALQAYDCAANPDHPPKGEARALWDCLWQVGSCKNVEKCVFPKGDQPCNASDFVRCSNLPEAGEVRLDCETTGAAAPGENCALWGQTCVNVSGVEATCTGDPGTVGCSTSTCAGTVARWCADGGIAGIDCSLSGGQACALQGRGSSDAGAGGEGGNASGDAGDADAAETGDGSAGSAGHYPVCAPSGDGGTCAFDASASCSGGVATSCPDGVIERVDCAA